MSKSAYGLRVPFASTYATEFAGPQIGDVVVLDSPEEDKVLLKRIVGVPGTRIEIRNGRIRIDGQLAPVEEHGGILFERLADTLHAIRLTDGGGPDYGPVTIAEDQYLVMGDNRGASHDGRSFGLVRRDAIQGARLVCSGGAVRRGMGSRPDQTRK